MPARNKCKESGCNTQPTFGLPGKKAEYCKTHSTDGMEDVSNKKCKESDCNTQPTFGLPGKKADYCSKHSTDGMECVTVKKCKETGCNTQPNFGLSRLSYQAIQNKEWYYNHSLYIF